MNKVSVNAQDIPLPSWSALVNSFTLNVLKKIKCKNWELSILLCGDKTITELNNQYRNKNEPTDILSFNLGETVKVGRKTVYFPGDIVISLDTLRKNAEYFKTTEDEELRRLIIHGILHLSGMEHKTINPDEPMLTLQEEILNALGKEKIIPGRNGVKK